MDKCSLYKKDVQQARFQKVFFLQLPALLIIVINLMKKVDRFEFFSKYF